MSEEKPKEEQRVPTEEELFELVLGREQKNRYMHNGALAITMLGGKPAPWSPQGISPQDHIRISNTATKEFSADEERPLIVARVINIQEGEALDRYFSMEAADANILSFNNITILLTKLKEHLDLFSLTYVYRYDSRDSEIPEPPEGAEIIPL